MGFLALAQQGAFGNYEPGRQPFLQNYYGLRQQFAPQPFGGATPQMPSSPLAALQQPTPMTPTIERTSIGHRGLPMPQGLYDMTQAPPSVTPETNAFVGQVSNAKRSTGPTGFMGRLQSGFADLPNNSLFQLGMSLLGNAQNGGDWGQVGQDMMAFADRRRHQQQEDNQTRRAKVLEGRQDTAWSEREGQAAAFNQYLAGLSPEEAARVRAVGIEGLPGYLENQERMTFAREQADIDNRFRERQLINDRAGSGDMFGRMFQVRDAETMFALNENATQLESVALPQLRDVRNSILRSAEFAGQPLDYNTNITLRRWLGDRGDERQALETWRAQILGPALESLRGLGAMSEREMEAAMNAMSNPNMTVGAALQLIDQRISIAEDRLASARIATRYFQDNQGITGRTNQAGQSYSEYLAEELARDRTRRMEEGVGYVPSGSVAGIFAGRAGRPSQQQPAPSDRVLRYNPQTGQLE